MKADFRLVNVEAASVLLSELQRTANTLAMLDAFVAAFKQSAAVEEKEPGKVRLETCPG